jgi:putative phosphoesterase
MAKIGLISDTHGLLRPQAIRNLAGSELIIHAGDIGAASILEELQKIAPVIAVRGNNDREAWAKVIPETQIVKIDGYNIYVLHNLRELKLDPKKSGFHAIISGHSHQPRIAHSGGILYVNPGSAGPRRFRLPIAVGILHATPNKLHARIIELKIEINTKTRRRKDAKLL